MKDSLSVLQDIVTSADVSQRAINKVSKLAKKLSDTLATAKTELAGATDTRLSEEAFRESVALARMYSKSILSQEIQNSLSKVGEYNSPAFLTPLLSVANNEDMYEFVQTGTGWARNVSVTIDLDSFAGDISDYADAVEYARTELKVKDSRDPEKASKFWREKVWGTSLYPKTIKKRFEGMSSPAPFWSLINYGTATAEMHSDIGGDPYPRNARGNRFKEHAEHRIYRTFRDEFLKRREDNKATRATLQEEIKKAEASLLEVNQYLEELEREFENKTRVNAIANRLGVTITPKDYNRLFSALEDYRSGSRSGKSRLSFGGRRVSLSRIAEVDY